MLLVLTTINLFRHDVIPAIDELWSPWCGGHRGVVVKDMRKGGRGGREGGEGIERERRGGYVG